jgi:hypothetical protein
MRCLSFWISQAAGARHIGGTLQTRGGEVKLFPL